MATKKRKCKQHSEAKMTQIELLTWKTYEAEARAARSEHKLFVKELEIYLQSLPVVTQLRAKILTSGKEFDEKSGKARECVASVCQKYNLDPQKVIINDITGALAQAQIDDRS